MLPEWAWWVLSYLFVGWLFMEMARRGNPDLPRSVLVTWGLVLWPAIVVYSVIKRLIP